MCGSPGATMAVKYTMRYQKVQRIKIPAPAGAEWALGTTENIQNLTFGSFRGALGSPRNIVGKDIVLHLIADDVYIDIKFLSWSQGRGFGGFSYERSTKE